MSELNRDPLSYYTVHGAITDPGDQAGLFEGLPTDISALCQVVQGLLIHVFWTARYGVQLPKERESEVGIRHVRHMLRRVQELDGRPLAVARPPEQRLVGNCRNFSILLCAILRQQGLPARARCGFGAYFTPGKYEDHWVCEYWNGGQARWVMVDAQLDALQRQTLNISFNPLDVPADQFLPGGKGWQMCREGGVDPDLFGIFELHGLWFVRGDLVRDVAALNKAELLPWDGWGLIEGEDHALGPHDLALLDRAAALSLADNEAFSEMRSFYEENPGLRVPAVIRSYTDAGLRVVDLGSEAQS